MALVLERIQTEGIEQLSYLVAEEDHPDSPWGVLSGDSLFVSSAGRPDLLGSAQAKKLAERLFRTLRDFYLKLDDGVIVYPGHGAGSPCGADIGDRLSSSIGHERRFNTFLQFDQVKAFIGYALSTAPPTPTYYPRMEKVYAKGPGILGSLPTVRVLPPKMFKEAAELRDHVLIDFRMMSAFGGEELKRDDYYTVAFVTTQGVPKKCGRKRRDLDLRTIDALKRYVNADLRGTVIAV
jgi:hydroxyacylglutathione hydrolase